MPESPNTPAKVLRLPVRDIPLGSETGFHLPVERPISQDVQIAAGHEAARLATGIDETTGSEPTIAARPLLSLASCRTAAAVCLVRALVSSSTVALSVAGRKASILSVCARRRRLKPDQGERVAAGR